MMIDLIALFEEIATPNELDGEATRFNAISIAEYPQFRLAKDGQSMPVLLIQTQSEKTKGRVPSVKLDYFTVLYDIFCRVIKPDGIAEEGIFTVIRCTGRDKLLHTYFLRMISVLFDILPTNPSKIEVANAINNLIDLFRTTNAAPRKSVQGLWAELFVIDVSRQPELLMTAWHRTPGDRYDFNLGTERLEVKSTSQRVRQHHFTLEQLSPPIGTTVLIGSVFTEQVNNGTTIMNLVDAIKLRIHDYPELLLHLDRTVVATLGDNWRSAFEDHFDKHLALSTFAFYDALSIPCIPREIPIEVTEVHFRADLSRCIPIDLDKTKTVASLFGAVRRK